MKLGKVNIPIGATCVGVPGCERRVYSINNPYGPLCKRHHFSYRDLGHPARCEIEKRCCVCKLVKPLEDFSPRAERPGEQQSGCKSCRAEKALDRYRADPEKHRSAVLKHYHEIKKHDPEYRKYAAHKTRKWVLKQYGLDIPTYERIALEQDHCCWLCGQPEPVAGRRLAVDHDHKTGVTRRLLCSPCNQGLGLFRDDSELMRRAADYVEEFRVRASA